jgi:hypothetical protein
VPPQRHRDTEVVKSWKYLRKLLAVLGENRGNPPDNIILRTGGLVENAAANMSKL